MAALGAVGTFVRAVDKATTRTNLVPAAAGGSAAKTSSGGATVPTTGQIWPRGSHS